MKPYPLFFAALIPAVLSAAQPATEVRVNKLGPDSYEAVITTSETVDITIAQNALVPGAEQLCGEKKPEFGHYTFETNEPLNKKAGMPLKNLVLKQNFKCVATASSPLQQQSFASDWKPTRAQEANIQRLTYQYFKYRDTGKYKEAYSLFSDSFKASISEEGWLARVKKFNTEAGNPIDRQISKITWYNKPPSSPTPGIYAAADYTSQFQNIDIHCGFVIWKQQEDGSFQAVREEENFIDRKTQSTMNESDIAKIRAQYGCVALQPVK